MRGSIGHNVAERLGRWPFFCVCIISEKSLIKQRIYVYFVPCLIIAEHLSITHLMRYFMFVFSNSGIVRQDKGPYKQPHKASGGTRGRRKG